MNAHTVNKILPDPPLDSNIDVRSFALMNVEKIELRHMATRFESANKTADFLPAMRLLILSWDEKPSGSLPNDEAILCREAGVRPCHWASRKRAIMQDWVLCSDDRWYSRLSVSGVSLAANSKTKGRRRHEDNARAVGASLYAALPPAQRYLADMSSRAPTDAAKILPDDSDLPF